MEQVAGNLVLVDLEDLQGIAAIHTDFETLAEQFSRLGKRAEEDSAKNCVKILSEVMLGDSKDPNADMDKVRDIVKGFQQSLGSSPEDESSPDDSNDELDESVKLLISNMESSTERIEELCLVLEKEKNAEAANEMRRLIHTIKGEAAIMGFHEIGDVCHRAETYIEEMQDEANYGLMLMFNDWLTQEVVKLCGRKPSAEISLAKMLDAFENPGSFDYSSPNSIESSGGVDSEPEEQKAQPVAMEEPEENKPLDKAAGEGPDVSELISNDPGFYLDFVTEAREHLENAESALLECDGMEVEEALDNVNVIFRAFHTIKGVSGFLGLGQVESLTHESENLLDLIRKGKAVLTPDRTDVLLRVQDLLKKMLEAVALCARDGVKVEPEPDVPKIVVELKHLMENDDAVESAAPAKPEDSSPADAEDEDDSEDTPPQAKDAAPAAPAKPTVGSGAPGPKPPPASGGSSRSVSEGSIKVDMFKVDNLINMVGELVIAQSMLEQDLKTISNKNMLSNMSHVRKILNELQELAMSMRMIPLKTTFMKMSRVIRDVSRKKGRKVEFVMEGEDTELDRNVVEKIADPLIHMVRNSVDHGIEDEATRKAAGKSPAGTVKLRAFHKGGNILIEVEDDGKGLDKEKILSKAIDRGVVSSANTLTDSEILNLVFEPGLSTAEKVSDISGRGVGMDVVRKNIEALRGRIDISSTIGQGSRFTIYLPLTLAIIDGMVIRIGKNRYIIPTINIQQTLHLGSIQKNISTLQGSCRMLKFMDRMIPFLEIGDLFDEKVSENENSIVAILGSGERFCCILVDEIISQQEVVIKNLGPLFSHVRGVAGGAILSDGRVGVIVDVQGLMEFVKEEKVASGVPAEV